MVGTGLLPSPYADVVGSQLLGMSNIILKDWIAIVLKRDVSKKVSKKVHIKKYYKSI